MVYLSNKNNIKTNAILYDSFVSLLGFVIITLSLVSIQISLMKAIVNLLKCQNIFFYVSDLNTLCFRLVSCFIVRGGVITTNPLVI